MHRMQVKRYRPDWLADYYVQLGMELVARQEEGCLDMVTHMLVDV